MRRWITMLALVALAPPGVAASSEDVKPDGVRSMWSEIDFVDVAPRFADRLSTGPVNADLQTQLLLLSEDERQTFRGFLLERMSEDDIEARPDVFAIVGYPEGTLIDAEIVNENGRDQAAEFGGFDSGGGAIDGWQLYVEVPFYSQNDPHWAWYGLGFARCSDDYIWRYGCHLTCISMLYKKWGYPDLNPIVLNNWSKPNEPHFAFNPSGCGDLIRLPQALQYPNICRPWRNISSGEVYGQLQQGHPVIANTDQYGNHFVVIFAFDGSRYWVKDPVKDWVNQDQLLSGKVKSYRLYGY